MPTLAVRLGGTPHSHPISAWPPTPTRFWEVVRDHVIPADDEDFGPRIHPENDPPYDPRELKVCCRFLACTRSTRRKVDIMVDGNLEIRPLSEVLPALGPTSNVEVVITCRVGARAAQQLAAVAAVVVAAGSGSPSAFINAIRRYGGSLKRGVLNALHAGKDAAVFIDTWLRKHGITPTTIVIVLLGIALLLWLNPLGLRGSLVLGLQWLWNQIKELRVLFNSPEIINSKITDEAQWAVHRELFARCT